MNLIAAIKQNNQSEFFRLLALKINSFGKRIIDAVDPERKGSPLYWAASYGYTHFIAPLLKAGTDINKASHNGETPVFIAAFNGHASTIAILHAAGANVNTPTKGGVTPVFIAAEKGHAPVIAVLHKAGADVNMPMSDGATPVFIAAQEGHAEAIRALQVAEANVDMPNANGAAPIHVAAENGHALAITALYAARANVNAPTPDGATPVFIAALGGYASAIAALHFAEANMNTLYNGITPVYAAAQRGYATVITTLHKAGANVNTACNGITPVFVAAQKGHSSAIAALHAAGANMNAAYDGATPVFIAAQEGHGEVIRALKTANADVNMTCDGATPLFVAAQNGHESAITALLEADADATIKTPWGTALEHAKRDTKATYPRVVKLLEAHLKTVTAKKEATYALRSMLLPPSYWFSIHDERLGARKEARVLSLKQAITPTTQASVLENQKFVPSISIPRQNMQQMKRKKEQRIGILGIMKKTRKMADKVRLNALEDELAKGKKDNEELKLRLERLEKLYSHVIIPNPERRRDAILNLTDKKEESEKIRYVLESLRTFFLNNTEDCDKAENYAIYNEYLIKVNNNAQLLYNIKQNKHVLLVNGKLMTDINTTVEEISKMIQGLAPQSVQQQKKSLLAQP